MRLVYRQHDRDEDGHKWRYIGTDADGRRHFLLPTVQHGERVMNTICGWACFAVLTGAWALPTSLYLIGHNEIECHQERRLVWVNIQPRTELRQVCGERDEPHH